MTRLRNCAYWSLIIFAGFLSLEMISHLLVIRRPAEEAWVIVELGEVVSMGVDVLVCLLIAMAIGRRGMLSTSWFGFLGLLLFRAICAYRLYFAPLAHQDIPLIYKKTFDASTELRFLGLAFQIGCLAGLVVLSLRAALKAAKENPSP